MKNLTYTSPTVEVILLDNEISLQLQSTPPEGPDEGPYAKNHHSEQKS
jgi:hypothetical protein